MPGAAFFIAGANPSLGPNGVVAQAARQQGAPWWFGHALTQESYGGQQFYLGPNSAGYLSGDFYGAPVFGPPDGFGIAQVDGVSNDMTDEDFWSWLTNLIHGIFIANGNLSSAQSHLGNQISKMLLATQKAGVSPNYPAAFSAGVCSFSYPGTGNGAYYNADWMTEYNGKNFEIWHTSSLSWEYPSSYVNTICTNTSQTI